MYRLPLIREAFIDEKKTRLKLTEFILEWKPLSMGEQCNKFENKFSTWQERNNSILFNSGGSANLALIQALLNMGKLSQGDYVGFSALTWSTNVMPLFQMGLIPIPIDVDKDTLNISDYELLNTINKYKIKCLFLTNALGLMPSNTLIINSICKKNNIILIEDNCESLGSKDDYYKSGNIGLASTFSFFIAHHMSTIEGGMVCTDDEELSNQLKIVRANGWGRNLDKEYNEELTKKYNIDKFYSKYAFYDLGYNLRPIEITGFLGNNQIEYIDNIIKKREENYYKIQNEIINNDIKKLNTTHMKVFSSFCIPFIFHDQIIRNKYINRFEELGIETRPIIAGDITQQPFWKKYSGLTFDLPNTKFIHDNGFYCGNFPQMTDNDIDLILDGIR